MALQKKSTNVLFLSLISIKFEIKTIIKCILFMEDIYKSFTNKIF